METKVIEIRDHATCVPAVAIHMIAANPIEDRFLWRCGFAPEGGGGVVLMRLADQRATSDPYEWADRTHRAAHEYILANWPHLRNGDVVDVRVVLGETTIPAEPEIYTERAA